MNPNSSDPTPNGCPGDPFADPSFDVMGWIMGLDFPLPREEVCERAIIDWLTHAGFAEIKLQRRPERGELAYQAIMRRGTSQSCPNGLAAQALVEVLATDLGYHAREGEPCGLAWGDQVGLAFRLYPQGNGNVPQPSPAPKK